MSTMKKHIHRTLLLLLVSVVMVAQANGKDKFGLEDYRWKNRLILAFAPSPMDPSYKELEQEIAVQAEEINDRDILFFRILETGETQSGNSSVNALSDGYLRKKFSIRPGSFTVLLIGKDGGVKLRRGGGVELDEIFSLIDTMPMRQREMKEKLQQR